MRVSTVTQPLDFCPSNSRSLSSILKLFQSQLSQRNRLPEIDFLRGVAIILVLFRHHDLFELTKRVGWIGVDLFFVISGFLVSGLLFHEYLKYKKIEPIRFLIRRGFKIYPVFYFFLLISILFSLIALQMTGREMFLLKPKGIFGEFFFLQNYIGAMWTHTWSLAVEEHFYFLLAGLLFYLSRNHQIENKNLFLTICLFIFIFCFAVRMYVYTSHFASFNPLQTHLRVDSLMFGVLISYYYCFRKHVLEQFVQRHKGKLLPIGLVLIGATVYLEPWPFMVATFGLTFLYLGFGCILVIFLFVPSWVGMLKVAITGKVFALVTIIGFHSYSIYVFHLFVKRYFIGTLKSFFDLDIFSSFFLYFSISLLAGIVVAKLIEIPFLNIREIYFPKGSDSPQPGKRTS